MSRKYIGGIIIKNPTAPTTTVAKGIWTLDQAQNYIKQGIWPRSPGAPTVGTASVSVLTASVPFTAPTDTGSAAITNYIATSSPSGIQGTSATSPISVSGLSQGTSYTFQVQAINGAGSGATSASSNSVTTASLPGAPTIGTATVSGTTASVPFTAPASDGGATITTYTATSSPGGITGTLSQAGSGSVTVSGLTGGTSYTFTVTATNPIGTGAASAASNSITAVVTGQQLYTQGSYTWVAPAGVTSVSVVVVGGGGGGGGTHAAGGGALAYGNNISVTPGASYSVVVGGGGTGVGSPGSRACTNGGQSYFCSTGVLRATGGIKGSCTRAGGTSSGSARTGGGSGGEGGEQGVMGSTGIAGGGGGAGGYTGNGGRGRTNGDARFSIPAINAQAGSGGGGGGGYSGQYSGGNSYEKGGGGGGGVNVSGAGSNGTAASSFGGGGGGGSCGTSGATGNAYGQGTGGSYGGGGGGGGGVYCASIGYYVCGGYGGPGAVRIIWPGSTRQFPSTGTQNQ